MRKVAVVGAKGRMGSTSCAALAEASDLELVATLGSQDEISVQNLGGAEVALEFTRPEVSPHNVLALLAAGLDVVVGTSGWQEADQEKVAQAAKAAGRQVLLVPNFAISAVLVMAFAQLAAPFFTSAEVVETHHPQKLDAPSGTAWATADLMAQARQRQAVPAAPDATVSDPQGSRGAQQADIHLHALRIAGAHAQQLVILGNYGERLELRTDCYDRSAYMPGVLLALRKVGTIQLPAASAGAAAGAAGEKPSLVVGLDKVMDLGMG